MKSWIYLLPLLCARLAWAGDGASLWLPEEASIEALNGQPYSVGVFDFKKPIPLPAGQQTVTLHYTDVQPDPLGGSFTNYRSAPVVIYFTAQAGDNYEVHLPKISNETEAARFEKQPRFTVIERESHREVQQQVAPPVLVPVMNAATLPVNAPATASNAPVAASLPASNLWYWWQQADEATRKAFLQRIGVAQ